MRKILLIDLLLYGGLALVSVVVSIIAALTPQEWPAGKILVLGLVPSAFVAVALVVFLSRIFTKWDYKTTQGCYVWSSKSGQPSPITVNSMLDFFEKELPKLCVTYAPMITENILKFTLPDVRIEFRDKPLGLCGIGWLVKDKAGLQQGTGIMVYWTGPESIATLYHELLHLVDEEICGKAPDYKHEDIVWWSFADKLANWYLTK